MKTLFAMSLFLILTAANAEIVNPSEQALEADLNFKLTEQQQQDQRNIASDKENKNESEAENSDREVASDQEEQSPKIQYWKY